MPRAIPSAVRHAIWQRSRDGQDVSTIAGAFGLAPRTVRHLLSRFRRGGRAALAVSYQACGRATPKPADALVQAVLQMRRDHPTWGAGLIRVMLRPQRLDAAAVPGVRTLQRWLARAGLAPAPVGRRTKGVPRRAKRPHEVWQMDAAEQVRLRSGIRICWLRLVDEASGAVLWTKVFPPAALAPRAARRDPNRTPQGVPAVGPPRTPPGRQRRALGLLERPADGPGTVAQRPGSGPGVQPAAFAPGQRDRRAVSGDGQAVGRAGSMRHGGRFPRAIGPDGPDPARAIPRSRRSVPPGGLPGAGALGPAVHAAVGAGRMGLRGGQGAPGGLRGATAREPVGEDFGIQ
jgi:hypothetical protein